MKRKVLFLTSTFPGKDHPNKGIFNYRSVKSLSDDYEIDIYKLRIWKPFRPFFKKDHYNELGITDFYIPTPVGGVLGSIIYAYVASYLFRKRIRRNHYDLIYSSGLIHAGLLGSLLSRKQNIPHISQIIGSDVNFMLEKQLRYGMSNVYYQGTKAIISVSDTLAKKCKDLLPGIQNIQVIYRGINLKKFSYTPYDIHSGSAFLYLGGFPKSADPNIGLNLKGGKHVIETWSENENWFKENSCTLTIGGPFSDDPEWQTWRQSLQYPEQVTICGRVDEAKVIALISSHDILLMPSIAEGLPNLAVEASAIGRFIIASDTGGIPEIIDNGHTGITIPAGSKPALKEAMMNFANKKDTLQAYGERARRKMEQGFDDRNFSTKTKELFQQAIIKY